MSASLLALAALALGQALQVRDGLYDPLGIVLLTAAIAACAAAFAPRIAGRFGPGVHGVLTAGLLLQFLELFIHRPGSASALARGLRASMLLHSCLGAAMVCAAMIALGARRWRAAFWVATGMQLAAAFWVVRETPGPHMDVWWAQQAGLEALMRGESPFSSSFPDIYGGTTDYPPRVRDGGSIRVGFPYPPVTLLAALPSFVLAGDLRWGNAVMVALAGILVAHLSRTRAAALAALVLIYSPRVFYFLESGWAEPAAILLFAGAVFCATRRSAALPLCLGLAAVSKQTMPLLLGLVPLLGPVLRALPRRPMVFASALAGPLITVLAVLTDPDGFVSGNVTFPAEVPIRTDVLSYAALFANELGIRATQPAVFAGFALALVAIATMWRVAPRTPAGFAAGCGTAFLVFFAFNKYAAINYYFFAISALCCAVAAHVESDEPAFS